jgi:hypothetical protein
MYKSIKKRDGRTAKFDRKKIEKAIEKAGLETGEFDAAQAVELTDKVLGVLETRNQKRLPSVEDIQDIVLFTYEMRKYLLPLIIPKRRGESDRQFLPETAVHRFAARMAYSKHLDLSTTGAFLIRQIHERLAW